MHRPPAHAHALRAALLTLLLVPLLGLTDAPTTIFLPGSQPGSVVSFESPSLCQGCHQTSPAGHPVAITPDWRGSLMAHAARDPLFYAALAVANRDIPGVGEFCIRCHSPTGWLEGRSNPPTGQGLSGNDLNSVQCDFCHRAIDPLMPDSALVPPVPGYGNAMFVVQHARTPKRGPYSDALAQFHPVQQDSFYRRGDFCGVCHNVSNPLQASDPTTQSPHTYGVIERTYSEWKLSWYATQGRTGTCQACHMPPAEGYGCTIMASPLRPDIPAHDLTGGNTFIPDILRDYWPSGIDTALLAAGRERAARKLRSAATMEALAYRIADSVRLRIRVTNGTGHKLPTGYPEGRRMWLAVVGMDAAGDTLFVSGAYDTVTAVLTHDTRLRLYESEPGLSPAAAAQHGLTPGPSFHFVLNDTIYADTRIPPRGFSNAAFAAHRAEPVGRAYADGQYWDDADYTLPAGTTTVAVTLLYQTASREYIEFLRDLNTGNPYDWRSWGDSLFSSWSRYGKSRPVSMAHLTVPVTDSTGTFAPPEAGVPATVLLRPNYPNPFNPLTTIEFLLSRPARVVLTVYDLNGRPVARLVEGRMDGGMHRVVFDGAGLSSGAYLCRLEADNGPPLTRKLLLVK